MNLLNLTKKDLAVFFRDRGTLIWMFALPLVFVLIFAGLAGMSAGSSAAEEVEDTRPPLVVVNLDSAGQHAQILIDQLSAPDGLRLIPVSLQEAQSQLSKLKINRYLLVPADFSANLSQRKPTSLTLITHPDSNKDQNQTILRMVNGIALDVSLELQILDGIEQMKAMQAANPASQIAFDPERIAAQARSQFERSRETPLVAVRQVNPAQEEAQAAVQFNLGDTIVPGITVLFVFLAAQSMARSIHEERKNGSLRRLLSAPLRRWELLLGKMLPIWILTVVQIVFIFLVGMLLLPVLGIGKLGVGRDPFALVLVSLVMALCSTSLGILIAGLARTEGQISGLSNAILWVAGFLGGALIPVVLLQSIPVMNVVSRFVPHSWATSAYYDLLSRGKGLLEVLPNIGMLLVFTAVFFYIGVRRFRFE